MKKFHLFEPWMVGHQVKATDGDCGVVTDQRHYSNFTENDINRRLDRNRVYVKWTTGINSGEVLWLELENLEFLDFKLLSKDRAKAIYDLHAQYLKLGVESSSTVLDGTTVIFSHAQETVIIVNSTTCEHERYENIQEFASAYGIV